MAEHVHQNCESLLGSLSEYIDDGLSSELCQEIEKHLEGCENCRVVLVFAQFPKLVNQSSPAASGLAAVCVPSPGGRSRRCSRCRSRRSS